MLRGVIRKGGGKKAVKIRYVVVQRFSTAVPRNPRAPPAQSSGSARSSTSANTDSLF